MEIWGKDSTLKSILKCTCPRCHTGKMFEEFTLSKPSSLISMHKYCSQCNQSFEPEPGFYFGAMFVSYALNAALFISVWVMIELIFDNYSLFHLLLGIGLVALLSFPWVFRVSRSIWISLFVSYKGEHYRPR